MSRYFHEQLEDTKLALLHMVAAVDNLLSGALSALALRDVNAAKGLGRLDDEIDDMERSLDERCLQMLALDQPVAADLRYIIATMRITVDLERVGDKSSALAKHVVEMEELTDFSVPPYLLELGELSHNIFRRAIDSFRLADAGLAREVFELADRAHATAKKVIHASIDDSALTTRKALTLVLVSRIMERIIDLSTNIAESTVFILKGVSIKHHQWPDE